MENNALSESCKNSKKTIDNNSIPVVKKYAVAYGTDLSDLIFDVNFLLSKGYKRVSALTFHKDKFYVEMEEI